MTDELIIQFYGALADELVERFPDAIVYRTRRCDQDCVEIVRDGLKYQIVFEDGCLKRVRFNKNAIPNPFQPGAYRMPIKEYDISNPHSDLEPLISDLESIFYENIDDC